MKPVSLHTLLLAAALLPLAMLGACQLRPVSPDGIPGIDDPQAVEAQLAVSVQHDPTLPGTRMSDAVTQIDAGTNYNAFRGIDRMYIIPFNVYRTITASDSRHGRNLVLPQQGIPPVWGASANTGLVVNNNSHLYEDVLMKAGTASVLVYGRAIDENVSATPSDSVDFKRRNGVLRAHGLTGAETPMSMEFTLEPIMDAAAETAMNSAIQGVLTYLNSIAAAQVSHTGYGQRTWNQTTWTYTWRTPSTYNHSTVSNAFETLTGSGRAFSGSTDAVAGMLTTIYNGLYDLASDNSVSSSYNQPYYGYYSNTVSGRYYYVYELSRQIRTLIDNSTYVTVTGSGNSATVAFKAPYAGIPANSGLPDGAVSIQWNGSEFVQITAANSALAPISSYCYPPSLWYWTNSRLKTSNSDSVNSEYVSSNTTWETILANYTYGSTVLPGVASAAIIEPLQYGVGQLRIRLNFASSALGTENLSDSQYNTVNVNNTNFPLTGILVSEQKNQAFNFTPRSGDSYCIFDADVNDGSTPKAYIASAGSGVTLNPIHTLVVQTESNQDVHYALEFQNNSNNSFYGANACLVTPGSKFYLVGILELSKATNSTSETINSVFLQDHITEAIITVKGLAAAYNTIPELRDPQLEIGVQTEMKWVGVTPSQIPMY